MPKWDEWLAREQSGRLTPSQQQLLDRARQQGRVPATPPPPAAPRPGGSVPGVTQEAGGETPAARPRAIDPMTGLRLPTTPEATESYFRDVASGAEPGMRFGASQAIGVGLPMAGAALGAASPVPGGTLAGEVLGSYAARKLNVARGAEEPGLGGDILSVGVPAAMRGAGGLIKKGVQSVFPARRLAPGAQQASETMTALGQRLTPAQMTESRTLDILENIAESSLVGGGAIKTQKLAQRGAVTDKIEEILGKFTTGASRESVGTAVQGALEHSEQAWKHTAKGLYKGLDQATRGAMVNMVPVKQAAEGLMPGPARLEMGYLKARLNDIQKLPDVMTFSDAHALRSDLMDIARGVTAPGGPATGIQVKAKGPMSSLARDVYDQMKDAATNAGPDVYAHWREVDTFYRQGAKTFNHKIIRQVAKASPDVVTDLVVKANHPTTIRTIRTTMNDPEAWKGVRSAWIERLLQSPTVKNPTTGELSGKGLENTLQRFGTETLKEIFPGGAGVPLKRLAQALSFVEQKSPEGIGTMAVQLAQGGMLLGAPAALLSGHPAGAASAAGILLTPAILGQALTRPKIADALIHGLTVPTRSPMAAGVSNRLIYLLLNEGLIPEQRTQAQR